MPEPAAWPADRRITITDLQAATDRGERWSMLTSYDTLTAGVFEQAGGRALLVGDTSAEMVLGHETTVPMTMDQLVPMVQAVVRGTRTALVVADLPFGSYEAGPEVALLNAVRHLKEGGAQAVKLETNADGTAVTEVVVDRDGERRTYSAELVVLACGAANTAKLLLVSANDKHPQGLANGSDQVGRNYMFHNSQAVLALSKDENPTVFQKTLGLNDFYFASEASDYPLGNIQMVGKSQAPMFRGEKPGETKLAPQWSLERVARHAIDFWLSTEDLPRPENRVSVDGDGKVTLSYTSTNDTPKKELYGQLRSLLHKLHMEPDHLFHRFAYMKNEIPVAGVAHQAGTCRMGSDPATSVLNPDCRAHELDNLYVVDTSVFPSIGAVNPALTAMANSLRVGDHLLERMGAKQEAASIPG